MQLKDKIITIVGLGKRTGVETVKFLAEQQTKIIVTDTKSKFELKDQLEQLKEYQVQLDLGGHSKDLILTSDLIVISPGVPVDIPILQQARQKGIEIISEIELAYRFCNAPIIGITGTNGKTTTTTLLGKIFNDTEKKTVVGGNIGTPLIKEVPTLNSTDLVVAEISSFQLEAIKDFRPCISLILNITPDHLGRHGTFKKYIKAKRSLITNQTKDDYTVLNYDDELVKEFAQYTAGEVVFFSQKVKLEQGVYVAEDKIISNLTGVSKEIININQIGIKGPHNLENVLGVVAVSLLAGIDEEILISNLKEFTGVEHRIEEVANIKGVKYINDSKGTNPVAATKALDTYQQPIILIAGGYDKRSNFNNFALAINRKVKELILLGETANKIKEVVEDKGFTRIHRVDNISEAVSLSARLADQGDVVLLSPACASWDMFSSYEERGELFKQEVQKLVSSKE